MRKPPTLLLSLFSVFAAAGALADQGLSIPHADQVWPQWQARITVSTARLDSVALVGLPSQLPHNALQSGAVLSDFYFDSPGLRLPSTVGGLRATGGLVVGPRSLAFGGAPAGGFGQRLGLSVQSLAAPWPSDSSSDAAPYLGIGYTSLSAKGGWGLTADFGLVAENPSGLGRLGRGLLGSDSLDNSIHDLRISPLLQVGVRYAF